jgi:hypothetical protein
MTKMTTYALAAALIGATSPASAKPPLTAGEQTAGCVYRSGNMPAPLNPSDPEDTQLYLACRTKPIPEVNQAIAGCGYTNWGPRRWRLACPGPGTGLCWAKGHDPYRNEPPESVEWTKDELCSWEQ